VSVSIIMRSKDADWIIDQTLAALFSQTFREFELVVVDSGSTDGTLEMVRRYPCRLVTIRPEDYFPGAVLNAAIRGSTAETLVFLGSDAVMRSPHALGRLLAAFADPAVAAAFGRQIPRPEAHGWVRRDYAASFPAEGAAPPWMALSLVFAAMRRAAWERHPFYTDAWASEDAEWGAWAKRSGLGVRYVAEATVTHSHNYALREIYGRRFVEGEADAFIHRDEGSVLGLARRALGSIVRDVVWHARERDLLGLCAAPVRRAVYHAAYHRGHRHGEERRARGGDARFGQRVVLERYGGAAAREVR
jgi:rhamnosyltransferase